MSRILSAGIIIFILTAAPLNGQSLEELRQLEQVKKQLEDMGELPEQTEKPDAESARSLEVFQDTVSKLPQQKQKKQAAAKPADTSEQQRAAAQTENETLPYFGFDVFKTASLDLKPEVYGPVDADYPLGPGDEIVITVWGEVELRHELTINRQGQLYIPDVGLVEAMGLTVDALTKKLTNVMGQSYASILKGNAFLDVSLGKLRTIRIYVVGHVNQPGVYTVPAFTSAFHMLFYANGVRRSGSLRNIRIVRKDRVLAGLDFYEFLTEGKKFAEVRLQNNDVIVVPPSGKLVHLNGAVVNPAIYELKEAEGLTTLFQYAGGFKENAYIELIPIERFVNNKERKLLEVNYDRLRRDSMDFDLKDGDRISVLTLDRDLENYVTINGPIYGPRRFEFYRGMTISELFTRVDSVKGDAYLERVHITRTLPDDRKRLFSINLREFLENEQQDFLLAPEDQIAIQSVNTLFPADSVHIFGAVNRPGTYLLKEDMTLKDLIFAAGGFREDAVIEQAEISRVDPQNPYSERLATILHVAIDSNYTKRLNEESGELFFLQPYDNVFIRANSDWELQRNVTIRGEVDKPGVYTLRNKTERITDVIARAGGLKATAYPEGATLVRNKNNVGQIGLDFNKVFEDPARDENIYLQHRDVITIPERLSTVKIVGGVHFPSSILFEKGRGMDYYLQAAGGLTDLADKDNITVRLANGRTMQPQRFLFWEYLPDDITAGSTIVVPVLQEREGIDWSSAIRDVAAIMSSAATTILIIDRLQK